MRGRERGGGRYSGCGGFEGIQGGDLACWWEGSRVSGRLVWGLGGGKAGGCVGG